ncbi:outer-membrane lipoprotein carrier protein LolA [Desulfonema limicola]
MKLIREKFTVSLEKNEDTKDYKLKLVPIEKKLDISMIFLLVSRQTYDVVQIATYNSYEDETIINMSNLQFNQDIDDSVFSIQIPEGADVIKLED